MNVSSIAQRLTVQMVSQAALQNANNDGDGKTGAAALNDGDAAAHAAARHVIAKTTAAAGPTAAPAGVATPNKVDVKA